MNLTCQLAETEAARDRLARREKELESEVQKLEMKVLELTQTMAKMEGDHVQRMREKQEELDRCKVGRNDGVGVAGERGV